MIVRVVRFQLQERVEPSYMEQVRRTAEELIGNVDGLLELRLMRSSAGARVTVVGTSVWRDYAAMDAFYGSELNLPRLFDPHGEFVENAIIEHYEHVLTRRAEPATEPAAD